MFLGLQLYSADLASLKTAGGELLIDLDHDLFRVLKHFAVCVVESVDHPRLGDKLLRIRVETIFFAVCM